MNDDDPFSGLGLGGGSERTDECAHLCGYHPKLTYIHTNTHTHTYGQLCAM